MVDATSIASGVKAKNPNGALTQMERVAISDARMLEAAMRLISERGTHHTTLKDVGEEAGYSRGLASNRFGSKDALFSKLVTYFNTKWKRELDHFVGNRKGLSALLASLDAVEDFLLTQPVYMTAMYILWYESMSGQGEVRQRLARLHHTYRQDAATWLEQAKRDGDIPADTDSTLFATLYWSFLSGTIYQWLVNPSAVDVSKVFRFYKKTALTSLGAKQID